MAIRLKSRTRPRQRISTARAPRFASFAGPGTFRPIRFNISSPAILGILLAMAASTTASARHIQDHARAWRTDCIDGGGQSLRNVEVDREAILESYRDYYAQPYNNYVYPLMPYRSAHRADGKEIFFLFFRIDGVDDISIVYVVDSYKVKDRFIYSTINKAKCSY